MGSLRHSCAFCRTEGTALPTPFCYFHLVAFREAAQRRQRRNNERFGHLARRGPEPWLAQVTVTSSTSDPRTLTPQLRSDSGNSRLSQAAGRCCASVLPEQERGSWAAHLCSPGGKEADVLRLLPNTPAHLRSGTFPKAPQVPTEGSLPLLEHHP